MSQSPTDELTVPLPAERDLAPGSVFGRRYVIERRLGQGGMGVVYAARDAELEVPLALKLLRSAYASGSELAERFRREVRLARRVTHRNAARVYDIGRHEDQMYMTMELIEGTALSTLMARTHALPVERVADIGIQICDGLAAAHEAGVIHRDLKPANILVENSGRVVVTDFGISCGLWDDPSVTVEGSIMGTPAYMAPEQLIGAEPEPRTDLFALGVILYELLTGKRGNTAAVAALDLSALAHVPAELVDLVKECTEIDPAGRPASAREVRRRLVPLAPQSETAETLAAAPRAVIDHRFAALDPGGQALVVLPLRHVGPENTTYLAAVVTQELVDLLSMRRGLRVQAASGTPHEQQPNFAELGRSLAVDAILDGTVHHEGARLRISARLIDAVTGHQTWHERFEGPFEDVFGLQDRLVRRIVETLRLELDTRRDQAHATPAAVELYLRGRWKSRAFDLGGDGNDGAVALYERCLELAPNFRPAMAAYAAACARMLFNHQGLDQARDWPTLTQQGVERALQNAPDLPETHLGAARMHVQGGDYRTAALALREALTLAPTCAAAHAFLGTLQCEAGLAEQGIQHIELAWELDPNERWAGVTAARHWALGGNFAAARGLLSRLQAEVPDLKVAVDSMALRYALWWGEREVIEDIYRHAPRNRDHLPYVASAFAMGVLPLDDVTAALERRLSAAPSPRLATLLLQSGCELAAFGNDLGLAADYLRRAAQVVLVDLDWLDRCPLLVPLHGSDAFVSVRHHVFERASAIWSVE